MECFDRSKRPVGGSSDFLGDPPPDPRFLASLGALSLAELHHCCVVDLFGGFCTTTTARRAKRENGGLGEDPPGNPIWCRTGPKDLLVGHRISWGILPQTPVFSLRSARCRGQSCITAV
jgi:hypothetical protein